MEAEKSIHQRERLNRWTVECPNCQQVWLAPGLAGGDEYACKKCGTVFLKQRAAAARRRCEV